MVNLLFSEGPGSLDLVFGATGTPPVIIVVGWESIMGAPTMAGVLESGSLPVGAAGAAPGIQAAIALSEVPALSMLCTLSPVIADLAIGRDNAVNRAPARWAEEAWQDGACAATAVREGYAATRCSEAKACVGIGVGSRRSAFALPRWQGMDAGVRPSFRLPWGAGLRRHAAGTLVYQDLLRHLRPALAVPFAEGSERGYEATDRWIELFRRPRPQCVVPWFAAACLAVRVAALAGAAAACGKVASVPWAKTRKPPHGVSSVPVDPPGPPRHVPELDLLFDDAAPGTLALLFGRASVPAVPGAGVVIPYLRAYIVVNEVTLIRTDNALALAPLALSVAIDADSWVWGWQATLPASSLDDVLSAAPGSPVEFSATINGVNWLLIAESVRRDRRFAQARITVSGRGIAAELGSPYAAVVSRNNVAASTAQQVAAAALTVNGVPIGWALDWQLDDWLVPAGAWLHTGSHIQAVARIAEAAGGYVQTAPNSRVLRVLKRYPAAPWDWDVIAPHFSLPSSATTREALEWRDTPNWTAVYVSGEGAGVVARVQRAGTAGDLVAPLIVDPLVTHADAARQRGLAVLSEGGAQRFLSLETPLFSGVGIYPVGSMVRFVEGAEWRQGIVRSLRVDAALPRVRQSLEVECRG